jgi:hypothetical protein
MRASAMLSYATRRCLAHAHHHIDFDERAAMPPLFSPWLSAFTPDAAIFHAAITLPPDATPPLTLSIYFDEPFSALLMPAMLMLCCRQMPFHFSLPAERHYAMLLYAMPLLFFFATAFLIFAIASDDADFTACRAVMLRCHCRAAAAAAKRARPTHAAR